METWYRVRKWARDIDVTPVQVQRETSKTLVLYLGTNRAGDPVYLRTRKDGSGEQYFRSEVDACIALRDYVRRRMDAKRQELIALDQQYEELSRRIMTETVSDNPSDVALGPFPGME